MLAGTFGWNPVAGIDYYLSIPPPDVVPSSVSRYLAETLNRIVPDLPERSGPINVQASVTLASAFNLSQVREYYSRQFSGRYPYGDLVVGAQWVASRPQHQ